MYAKIQPVTIFPSEAEILYCVDLRIQNIGNFATAQIVWELQSSSREVLKNGCIQMSSEEYNSWGAEDSYIFELIASKLNLTITEYVSDVVTVNDQITDSVTQSINNTVEFETVTAEDNTAVSVETVTAEDNTAVSVETVAPVDNTTVEGSTGSTES